MFRLTSVSEPRISFYLGEDWNPRRIVKYKPFTYATLKDKEIVLKVLTDAGTEKLATKMVNKLIDGYKGNYFYPPFSETYGMQISFDEKNDVAQIDEGNALSTFESVADSIAEAGSPGVIMVATNGGLPSRIYRGCKLKVITKYSGKNVRAQFVKRQTIDNLMNIGGFEFFLINIATAVYAKAGGIPWKLSRSLIETRGLILGISFARKREESGDETIYYGAVELLDRYGEHLYTRMKVFRGPKRKVETKGLYVPYDSMVELLDDAIQRYGRPPLIVVHKSSPFVEDEEIKAINYVREKYGDKSFQISLIAIYIKGNTIYRLFDTDSKDYSPVRGYLLVDEGEVPHKRMILFTTGRLPGEDSRRRLGTPRPLELNVAVDTIGRVKPEWLATQVLGLTKLDWNTTEPDIRTPITIKYSNKAARLAQHILAQEAPDLHIGDIRDLM